jgi:UDP-N-acetylmuramoyl-tripeptide--D-alanyl-D-alanine ligase
VFDLSAAAMAIGARHLGADVEIGRVTTDSRDVGGADLFVALKGPRFDGHGFVDQALAAGAAAAMVSDAAHVKTKGAPLLLVPDTRTGLGRLAAWWRSRFDIALIAVTGSNGKTTVKEMLAAILRAHSGQSAVLATEGNLNNDIGVPLTLLRLESRHRCAVIEMGMNHLGEIAYLSRLARPTAALINNAGTAHIGEVGSVEAIARAKGEILEGLPAEGIAILNSDDAFADYWRQLARGKRIVDFGLDRRATVTARYELGEAGSLVTVTAARQEFVVRLAVAGVHNVRNALAAATAAWARGVPAATIAAGLSDYRGVAGRTQQVRLANGALLIDDTYNANPESMKAALSVLGACAGKRIFVMGDMGELGESAGEMHAEIGLFARRAGAHRLFALGEESAAAAKAFGEGAVHFDSAEALIAALRPEIEARSAILVKGSRFMRMERVVDALVGRLAEARGDH